MGLGVPASGFKVEAGTPKAHSKIADSGYTVTSRFCDDCASVLWRETGLLPDVKIIKAGVLDDENTLSDNKPGVEMFVGRRVSWLKALEGAEQKPAMP